MFKDHMPRLDTQKPMYEILEDRDHMWNVFRVMTYYDTNGNVQSRKEWVGAGFTKESALNIVDLQKMRREE